MSQCCNCKCEISSDEKTKLCNRCKSILLPFVKFMDASTSSAVRRLVSNERNLRNAGVTDSGMEYLLRICELHDRNKMEERERREAAREADRIAAEAAEIQQAKESIINENLYSEVELPLDEPLNLRRNPYGVLLLPACIVSALLGLFLIGYFIYDLAVGNGFYPVPLACGIGLIISSYGLYVLKSVISDLSEIKKRFR